LAALRKEKMLKLQRGLEDTFRDVTTHQPLLMQESTSTQSGLMTRIQTSAKQSPKSRRKRSDLIHKIGGRNGWGMAFAKRRITWRLVRYPNA